MANILDTFHIFALQKRNGALKIVIIAIILIAIAVVLLGVKVFFVKGGRFPSSHVHDNAALRRRGISCAGHDNKMKH
ncbi:MAG: hypothetical protein NC117_08360 [Pseudoflavonifractor sp.]|nr:hypothetical protein [Pseudoflavonifractor sp.]